MSHYFKLHRQCAETGHDWARLPVFSAQCECRSQDIPISLTVIESAAHVRVYIYNDKCCLPSPPSASYTIPTENLIWGQLQHTVSWKCHITFIWQMSPQWAHRGDIEAQSVPTIAEAVILFLVMIPPAWLRFFNVHSWSLSGF